MVFKMISKLFSIVLVSSLPFLFSLNGDFVFDDSEVIVNNKDIVSDSWFDAFANDFWGTNIKSNLSHKSYRPLTILSYRLNYYINGKELSATQFKAINLFCHIICCVLVWMTYCCMWKRFKKKYNRRNNVDVPFLATMMFSTHPVHVEAVCGVVGRADLLAAATFLLSFLSYDKATRNKRFSNIYLLVSIILSGISMLFKENGITVLGVCLMYDLVLNLKTKTHKEVKNKNAMYIYGSIHVDRLCVFRICCIVLSTILLLYARLAVMGGTKPDFKPLDNPTAFSDSLFIKISTYNYIYFLNILLLIWPQWLCYDWSMGCIPLISNVLDFRIILSLLLHLYAILLIVPILINKNRNRIVLIGISLLVIPFLPASNILYPVGFVIAERILYISSIGYCFLVTIGFKKFVTYMGNQNKISLISYFCIILIYGAKSWQRSFEWQDEYKLFTSALSVCPLNAKVHYNVAKVVDEEQYTHWALLEYKEAIRLHPEYYQAMNNLANLLKNQKKYGEAELHLRNALHYKKEFPAAWMNLGIVLANTGRFNESEIAYKTALRYRKKFPDCYYNLGNLYLTLNRSQDAIENWYRAINLNRKHVSAWTNLLALLDNTGKIEEAFEIVPKALTELSDAPSVNFAIANIYGKINRYNEAEKHFLKAIELFKNRIQPIHYANLGVLYHRWKKYDSAELMYEMALKIDPNFYSAAKNLRSLKRLKKP